MTTDAIATSTPSASIPATARQGGVVRRSLAGLLAALTLAFGGISTLSPADAQAAGVRQQTYVVQSSTVQLQSSTPATGRDDE